MGKKEKMPAAIKCDHCGKYFPQGQLFRHVAGDLRTLWLCETCVDEQERQVEICADPPIEAIDNPPKWEPDIEVVTGRVEDIRNAILKIARDTGL